MAMKCSRYFCSVFCCNVTFPLGPVKIGVRCVSLCHTLSKKKKIIAGKPYRTEEELARKFVDHKLIKVFGGKGGDGRSSFLREKYIPLGGPDGGNGGNGGDAVFVADNNIKSLEKISTVYKAEDGVDGGGTNSYGRNGKSLFVKFPAGTYFRSETGEVVHDLAKHGDQFVAAHGGLCGKGNRFFVTNTFTAPEECTPGEPGESRILVAELRTLAHVGLVGFPNAGKSTLLRMLTRATPQVGEYQFTTLRPHVGILHFEDFTQIAVADIPGIIEGAHRNQGLGLTFLRHIERCRFLIYLLDFSAPDPWKQLLVLRSELSEYEDILAETPSIYVANKMDLKEARDNIKPFREKLFSNMGENARFLAISGKMGTNLEELIHAIRHHYDEDMRTKQQRGMTVPMTW